MPPTPDDPTLGFLARTRHLVDTGERFRWISEPRRRTYATILHALHRRRRAHEHEVPHDELLGDVAGALDGAAPYDPHLFRQDLEQLQRWGNVVERVEPARIQSLSDRGRHKLLLRIDPTTAHFLDFLEARANPAPVGLREEGANLLEDVLVGLREARKRLREAAELLADGRAERAPLEEALLRAAHLVREADQRSDRIAEELVEFGELLARFVAEPFRIEALRELTGWLERYVDRYLVALEEKGGAIRRALQALHHATLVPALDAAERCEEERLAASPELARAGFRLQPLRSVAGGLERFYAPTAGLAALCRRINRRTRAAIRRLQRHIEAVRLRNVRTEAIRARCGELFALPAGDEGDVLAKAFVEGLVAPVLCRTDRRDGNPEQRVAPPRPARRYESLRPTFRGAPLEGKRSTPEASRELERRRLARISWFVEERVLRGRDRARLAEADLVEHGDARLVAGAVAAWFLRGGRSRRHLGYRLRDDGAGRRARLEAPEGELDVRDLEVRRAGRSASAKLTP